MTSFNLIELAQLIKLYTSRFIAIPFPADSHLHHQFHHLGNVQQ